MDLTVKNILVGFDNSESAKKALTKSVDTAQRADAHVHVVYATGSSNVNESDLRATVDDLRSKTNVKIELHVRNGQAFSEIIAVEKEIGADLIIVGSHSSGGWKPFWAGKNAFRVISASNCPVITIQEYTKEQALEDIILPLDDSNTTRQKVPYCAMMAKLFQAKVHIYGVSKSKSGGTQSRVKAYVKQTAEYLAERGIAYEGEYEFGVNVPEKIKAQAKKVRAGLIVIMSDTESQGLIMGSYSQDLVNTSLRPVMSIHSRDLKVAGSSGY